MNVLLLKGLEKSMNVAYDPEGPLPGLSKKYKPSWRWTDGWEKKMSWYKGDCSWNSRIWMGQEEGLQGMLELGGSLRRLFIQHEVPES